MPPQKDTRPLVEKIDDVLYDLLTPSNDYIPEALTAIAHREILISATLNPDSEVSAGHQPGNIINHGFHLRRRLGLRNKNIQSPLSTVLWHGYGIQVNKIENAGLVPGAPRINFGIRVKPARGTQ